MRLFQEEWWAGTSSRGVCDRPLVPVAMPGASDCYPSHPSTRVEAQLASGAGEKLFAELEQPVRKPSGG